MIGSTVVVVEELVVDGVVVVVVVVELVLVVVGAVVIFHEITRRKQAEEELRRALEQAGTSFQKYRAVNGRSGAFQEQLRVYAREGEACRTCGAGVERIVQAGRSTFFCPTCQR